MRQLRLSCFLSLLVFLPISGCSSRSGDESGAGSTPGPTVNTSPVSLNKDDYPVFPAPDVFLEHCGWRARNGIPKTIM